MWVTVQCSQICLLPERDVRSPRTEAPRWVTTVKTPKTVVLCWRHQRWAQLALITALTASDGPPSCRNLFPRDSLSCLVSLMREKVCTSVNCGPYSKHRNTSFTRLQWSVRLVVCYSCDCWILTSSETVFAATAGCRIWATELELLFLCLSF